MLYNTKKELKREKSFNATTKCLVYEVEPWEKYIQNSPNAYP